MKRLSEFEPNAEMCTLNKIRSENSELNYSLDITSTDRTCGILKIDTDAFFFNYQFWRLYDCFVIRRYLLKKLELYYFNMHYLRNGEGLGGSVPGGFRRHWVWTQRLLRGESWSRWFGRCSIRGQRRNRSTTTRPDWTSTSHCSLWRTWKQSLFTLTHTSLNYNSDLKTANYFFWKTSNWTTQINLRTAIVFETAMNRKLKLIQTKILVWISWVLKITIALINLRKVILKIKIVLKKKLKTVLLKTKKVFTKMNKMMGWKTDVLKIEIFRKKKSRKNFQQFIFIFEKKRYYFIDFKIASRSSTFNFWENKNKKTRDGSRFFLRRGEGVIFRKKFRVDCLKLVVIK